MKMKEVLKNNIDLFLAVIIIVGLAVSLKECRNGQEPDKNANLGITVSSTPIPTPSPTPTMTPTPIPTPTPSPTPTPTPVPSVRKDVEPGHTRKPFARHTAYNLVGSAQWELQRIAETDEQTGIRIVKDPVGDWRYCVALGTYWAGAHAQHIGRCVDVHMVNGAVLKCVLADVKRQKDTKGGRNKYGSGNNDILEFVVDAKKLPEGVLYNFDMSNAGEQFQGDVEYMIVHDMWIDGFGG